MKISYCTTVCNEYEELVRLIDILESVIRPEDEICILVDEPKTTDSIKTFLDGKVSVPNFIVKYSEFKGNFADWKNEMSDIATGDYIFNLDADEFIDRCLVKRLPVILNQNSKVDLIHVPRINKVEGITEEYIKSQNWYVDSQDRINYPDVQGRIYRKSPDIRWTGKVHERVGGQFKAISFLPNLDPFHIYHYKTFDKQVQQNNLYAKL